MRIASTVEASANSETVEGHLRFIRKLVSKGGPEPHDYRSLDEWLIQLQKEVESGEVSQAELAQLRAAFGDALSTSTTHGLALRKPHGYAGDFEVIDRIYQQSAASEPHLAAWDRFCHQHAAPKAVRNRKTYFHKTLDRHVARRQPLRVLNVASGPGRCMYDWLSAHPDATVTFQCIETDPRAIAYSSHLNHQFSDRITFTQINAIRFRPVEQFDLIWAAGIFDYFTDEVFESLLGRLVRSLAPGGELVVGNFSDRNPTRAYMELLSDWHLHHRTPKLLLTLAESCGVAPDDSRVDSEPEGVNLFLHISTPLRY